MVGDKLGRRALTGLRKALVITALWKCGLHKPPPRCGKRRSFVIAYFTKRVRPSRIRAGYSPAAMSTLMTRFAITCWWSIMPRAIAAGVGRALSALSGFLRRPLPQHL